MKDRQGNEAVLGDGPIEDGGIHSVSRGGESRQPSR